MIQIINGVNDFYKMHIFKKAENKTFHELKMIIYNLEQLKSKLIGIFQLVAFKYNIIKNIEKTENKKRTKNTQKIPALNEDKNIIEFLNSNSILRKAIHYCVHDYIIDFIFAFNNEILFHKKLSKIIKEDEKEENFGFKYFTNIDSVQSILSLYKKYQVFIRAFK